MNVGDTVFYKGNLGFDIFKDFRCGDYFYYQVKSILKEGIPYIITKIDLINPSHFLSGNNDMNRKYCIVNNNKIGIPCEIFEIYDKNYIKNKYMLR